MLPAVSVGVISVQGPRDWYSQACLKQRPSNDHHLLVPTSDLMIYKFHDKCHDKFDDLPPFEHQPLPSPKNWIWLVPSGPIKEDGPNGT